MDPKDLELIKAAVVAAVKAHAEGQVPFAWVAVVVGALVSVIAALWAVYTKQSHAWIAKIEEVSKEQRTRDDDREKQIRERYAGVIDKLKAEQVSDAEKFEERIKRLEAGRDFMRDQYTGFRSETEAWLRGQLVEVTKTLDQANEIGELALGQLERLQDGDDNRERP